MLIDIELIFNPVQMLRQGNRFVNVKNEGKLAPLCTKNKDLILNFMISGSSMGEA